MAKTRKTPSRAPKHFFSKQLKGEAPLSYETATHLYTLAAEIYGIAPWRALLEDNLVFCTIKGQDHPAMISVMGARGEFHCAMVYLGEGSYRLFKEMSESEGDPAEYHSQRTSVHVEYCASNELEPYDRELLRAFGHPGRKDMFAPAFRATRKGYLPWPVNEQEGQILGEALAALITLLKHAVTTRQNPWPGPDAFPLVTLLDDWRSRELRGSISTVPPPKEVEPALELPELDLPGIRGVAERARRTKAWWELDYFASTLPIGRKDERRFCSRFVMAVDSGSGKVLHIEAFEPSTKAGDVLVKTALQLAEKTGTLPAELWVARPEHVKMLAGLGKALDVPVSQMAGLPGIDAARDGLMEFMRRGA